MVAFVTSSANLTKCFYFTELTEGGALGMLDFKPALVSEHLCVLGPVT